MKEIKKILLISVLLLFSFVGLSQIASADQMELQPSFDNTIYSELTTLTYFPVAGEEKSCGECTSLLVGRSGPFSEGIRRALIFFDIENNLPLGITVTNVELEITKNQSGDFVSRTMFVHPVTKMWGEGSSNVSGGPGNNTGLGGLAKIGDATWTDAIYDDTSNWTTSGGDFNSSVASASVGFGLADELITFSSPDLITIVQQWVDGSLANNGLLLKFDSSVENVIRTARNIYSSEGITPPILRITYDLPPPDDDEDGVPNSSDNCPTTPNPGQEDNYGTSAGDACEDTDEDTVNDDIDNCPTTPNPGQEDNYGTSAGDACEDTDEDTVNDDIDNCPTTPNPGQGDLDNDSVGNACDGLNLITSDTFVTANATSLGDVLIQNNSLLTIESGFTLTINSSLIVEIGSGALVKSGGTIIITA